MTEPAAGEAEGLPVTVEVDGVTVLMRPVGWMDYVSIPDELERVVALNLADPEQEADFRASHLALAARLDAYAAEGTPTLPSRVPARAMRAFVERWLSGVRDAAVPPASGGDSPSPPSTA